jgi:hypothetical protein
MLIVKNNNKITHIKKIPGNYYTEGVHFSTGTTSTGIVSGQLIYYAFILPEDLNIIEIGFNVTSGGGVGSTCKLNLYDSDPTTLLPRNKLLTDQTVATNTNGFKSIVVNSFLQSGLYYVAITRTSASPPTVTGKNNTGAGNATLALAAETTPREGVRLAIILSTFNYSDNLPNPAIQDSPNITYTFSNIILFWYKIG